MAAALGEEIFPLNCLLLHFSILGIGEWSQVSWNRSSVLTLNFLCESLGVTITPVLFDGAHVNTEAGKPYPETLLHLIYKYWLLPGT